MRVVKRDVENLDELHDDDVAAVLDKRLEESRNEVSVLVRGRQLLERSNLPSAGAPEATTCQTPALPHLIQMNVSRSCATKCNSLSALVSFRNAGTSRLEKVRWGSDLFWWAAPRVGPRFERDGQSSGRRGRR